MDPPSKRTPYAEKMAKNDTTVNKFLKHSSLQIIVFLAIMLHKAPASFGLVSFLLSKNVERHKIKKNLAIFAGAAPFTGRFKNFPAFWDDS